MIERTERLPEGTHADIIVLGGGLAGCAAAYAAALLGKKVILVEKSTMLGGLATLGQVNLFVSMCNGRGKLICRGMAEEFLKLSVRYGYGDVPADFVDGEIPAEKLAAYEAEGKNPPRYKTRFSIGVFSLQLTELLTKCGVSLYFDTLFSGVVRDEADPGRIRGVIIETKSGRSVISASQYVDTTGDADLFRRMGAPTVKRGGFHFLSAIATDMGHIQAALEAGNIQKIYFDACGGEVSLFGKGPEADLAVGTYDGTDGAEINRYLVANQLQMLDKWKDEEHRRERDIIFPSGMVQLRTTARIDGVYTMTTRDEFRHFDDSVSAICDFSRRGYLYEVPFRSLIVKGYDNCIAGGRIISADGWMWDATRVIPPAILTGQAAGTAAALAAEAGCAIGDVDIAALQKELTKRNVLLHFDDADVPAELVSVHEGE